MEIRRAHMNKLNSGEKKKITRKKNTYTKKSRKREKKNRLTMHSAHCTGYKGNEQNEHIHKNLFSSSIYVFFLLFFTIAFYLYAQIYYIILVLCFSPFETGVSLSGKAEKNLHALHSSFFIFSFITNNHCVYGVWTLKERLLPAFTLENRSRTKCDRTNRERDDEEDENKKKINLSNTLR